MIKRYAQHHKDYHDLVEDSEGEWVRFEDAQQACIESYNYGRSDIRHEICTSLGIASQETGNE